MYSSILGSGEEAADHAHEILAQLSCHGHLAVAAVAAPRKSERQPVSDAGGNRS